jgi:hypothetical protein
MRENMLKFMCFLVFLLGAAMLGLGGWMCSCHMTPNNEWGWFVFIGMVLTIVSLVAVGESSERNNCN